MEPADYTAPCTIRCCTRPADHGRYSCATCAERMRQKLREIEDYAATLDAAPTRGGDGGRPPSGFGSRPPARLEVIAALDPRTVSHTLGPDDTDNGVRSILGGLAHLAEWIAGEAADICASRTPTVASETRYLRARVDWCTGQQWIDELADDLAELHATARRLAGDAPPKPVAPCPDCDGPLWPVGETNTVAVRCGDCGTHYDGLNLLTIATTEAAA